jgi:hypothetical protein
MTALRVTRSGAPPGNYAAKITALAQGLKNAKEALEAAQEAVTVLQNEMLTAMSAQGLASTTVALGDARYKVTMVAGERLEIDEGGLRKDLSAPVFDKLCNLKIDRTKLELAIAEGRVDPVVVASHTTHRHNRPFVKLTVVAGSEQ